MTRRYGRFAPRRALAFSAVVTIGVVAALIIGAGWSVGRSVGTETPQTTAAPAAWHDSRGLAAPATEADAQRLRAEGWTLPTLATDGYTVTGMQRSTVAGQPVAIMTLDNDHHEVQIIEQRGHVDPGNPLDAVTGLPVSAEGLSSSAVPGANLWVLRSEPWRAVVARPDVVYTITSDAPPATLSRTLGLVTAEDSGRVTMPGTDSRSFGSVVVDGLREIFG